MMRWLSGLAVVLIVCLLVAAPMAMPAHADDPPQAYISTSPRSGTVGTEVTIYGYNFAAEEWVDIYYYLDTVNRIPVAAGETTTAAPSLTVTFKVPESHKGSHRLRAEVTGLTVPDATFTVTPGLTVGPTDGPVNTEVMVQGRGFAANEGSIEIRFGGQVVADGITANIVGSWDETIVVPSAAGGRHIIRAEGDDRSVATASFEVKPGVKLEEPSGSPGQTITMTGYAFAADERQIKILFDGEELVTGIRADEKGHWEEIFQVPELPAGNYTVTADGDRTKSTDLEALGFRIRPGLVLSPPGGHVGMNLTVTGRGFDPEEDVVILYDDNEVAMPTADDNGSFEVTFEVPPSRYGPQQVVAEDTEATAVFTMESDRPGTPELISPPDEGRAGFVGRIRPEFEWSEVSDLSGVYYRLQISTSANTTNEGEFVDPLLSRERLVEENYTLNKTEALSYATYYWIVQAVDLAQNAGNWTAPYSFRAGLLPMWAFIVIIVAVVLLGGGLAYFLVVRRRMYL